MKILQNLEKIQHFIGISNKKCEKLKRNYEILSPNLQNYHEIQHVIENSS